MSRIYDRIESFKVSGFRGQGFGASGLGDGCEVGRGVVQAGSVLVGWIEGLGLGFGDWGLGLRVQGQGFRV